MVREVVRLGVKVAEAVAVSVLVAVRVEEGIGVLEAVAVTVNVAVAEGGRVADGSRVAFGSEARRIDSGLAKTTMDAPITTEATATPMMRIVAKEIWGVCGKVEPHWETRSPDTDAVDSSPDWDFRANSLSPDRPGLNRPLKNLRNLLRPRRSTA